ncbi:MAG: response regulator [Opitutaceae bacterium]|jgi:DNA-binding response OmpR family regulator|nr:response regulator [Opitutaceae bacterium]
MSTKTILITDDEPHMRRLIAFSLKRTGHTLLQAESGEDALDRIGRETVDLLLIDYGLNGINGMDTINTMRQLESGSTIPVILLTALGDTGIRDDAQNAGVNAFMTKPFSPVELTQLVEELLAS